jgi:hypothetical protein
LATETYAESGAGLFVVQGVTMTELIKVNPDSRAAIEAALLVLRAAHKRAPRSMDESYHERYNAMLDDWRAAAS